MILDIPKNFSGFELLDTGSGFRLERWANVILQRPDPQIIWDQSLPHEQWDKAWAVFNSRGKIAELNAEGRGNWEIIKPMPEPWTINFGDVYPVKSGEAGVSPIAKQFNGVKFLLKLSPFKHTGLFAEQAANWEFMRSKIKDKGLKILNLFAYTGGATMVLAKAGCQVTHVDASKPAITWANENAELNKLPKESVRWIFDDCAKFVKREIKRGVKYDGIIMDPPAFGHSPTGKTWKFNDNLPGLLNDCVQLLSDNAKFLIVNGYATNSSALALNNLLEDSIKSRGGIIEFGELCLKQKSGRLISTGIFARWSAA